MVAMHALSGSTSFVGCATKLRARSELKACSRASLVVHAQQEEQVRNSVDIGVLDLDLSLHYPESPDLGT